jgi:hypothetical protein
MKPFSREAFESKLALIGLPGRTERHD